MLRLNENHQSPYPIGYRKATRTTRAELLTYLGVEPGQATCSRRPGELTDTLVVSMSSDARPRALPTTFQDFAVVYEKRVIADA